ncbi:MAG: hypothetical protein ACJAVV_001756 [Alphaproteobacteria bacterium]|jgi:hypothetical protein
MTYTIIIILIAFLIVCGIGATAVQQFNERKANEKREEVSRQRAIFDGTEESIVAALQMPVSPLLIALMRKRSFSALKAIYEYSSNRELKSKMDEINKAIKAIDINQAAPNQNTFILPKTDKVIIKYIQAVKKLRIILRSEYAKANITPKLYAQEEKALSSLQLRVNVETLMKRATDGVSNNMQGSARQYIEKAITALTNHKPQSDYTAERKIELESMLNGLEMNVKDNNLKQLMEEKEKENTDIESLFAPKQKW